MALVFTYMMKTWWIDKKIINMSLFSEVFPDFPLPKLSKEQMVLYCFFPYPPLQEKPYVVKIGEKSYSNLNDEQRTKMKDKLE